MRGRRVPTPAPDPQVRLFAMSLALHLALAAIVLIAWSNSFGLGSARDGAVVISDVRIQSVTAENIGLILGEHYWWPNPADRLYRPVTTLSFLLNNALATPGSAASYHAVNLLLHLFNTWLVLALARRLLRTKVGAFCAAAIWAANPITTESVTNIAGRADLLSTTAILSAILLYARFRSATGSRAWLAAVALFGIACIGAFSKENAAVLLGLLVLWDFAFGIGGQKGMLRRAPFYAAVAASLLLLLLIRSRIFAGEPWPARTFVDNPLIGAGFWVARFTAVKAVGQELALLVFPLRLSSDRSYNQIPLASPGDLWAWTSLMAILAILAIAILRFRKTDRVIFWSVGFLALTLLPTSNLIFLIGATLAERFLYLPSIGSAIAIAALIFRLKNHRISTALVACIVLLFAARTWLRNADWNDDLTLAAADAKAAPRSFRVHEMRARKLFADAPDSTVDEAIREGEAAWSILSPLPAVDSDQYTPARLGVYYRKKGDLAGGEAGAAWYRKSLAILLRAREISRANEKAFNETQLAHGRPLSIRLAEDALYFNLAATYLELGRVPEALEALRYERILTPESPNAYQAIARVEMNQGDFAAAAVALDELGLTSGPDQELVSALQDAYSHLPEGACAFKTDGQQVTLNPDCPIVLESRCRALRELNQVFTEARKPEAALHFLELAGKQGCQ